MENIKKISFTVILGILGFLLVLSGFNLIQLSPNLVLYSGIALFVIAGLLYFLLETVLRGYRNRNIRIYYRCVSCFLALGFILVFGGLINKHFWLIIGGVVYLVGVCFAFATGSYIPLLIAFVCALILRKIGLDPSDKPISKSLSDKEIIEKAWPREIKNEYTFSN